VPRPTTSHRPSSRILDSRSNVISDTPARMRRPSSKGAIRAERYIAIQFSGRLASLASDRIISPLNLQQHLILTAQAPNRVPLLHLRVTPHAILITPSAPLPSPSPTELSSSLHVSSLTDSSSTSLSTTRWLPGVVAGVGSCHVSGIIYLSLFPRLGVPSGLDPSLSLT